MKITPNEIVFGPEDLGDDRPIVSEASIPTRAALTTVGIFIRSSQDNRPNRTILLCNPHPDTWNTWMFPYSSRTLDVEGDFTAGMNARQFTQALARIWHSKPQISTSGLDELV